MPKNKAEKVRQKFNILLSFFPYGGNGGSPSEHPAIRNWAMKTLMRLKEHPLVNPDGIRWADFDDTPITMTRNRAVLAARDIKADILVMVDSDMVPDLYLSGPYAKSMHAVSAKPFIDTSLDIFDQWWEKGPVVIGAPYCGPPPFEPPYVFVWDSWPSEAADPSFEIRMMTRKEAHDATGVTSVAALPTGLIAFDMRVFEYSEPKPGDRGWFYYEFEDHFHSKKTGTEDVMCTRDLSLAVMNQLGYNPLKCAWDCWAGHMKPRVVGKPTPTPVEAIERKFRRSVEMNSRGDDREVMVGEPQPRI